MWFWNPLPGPACVVPAQLYQFGFAPNRLEAGQIRDDEGTRSCGDLPDCRVVAAMHLYREAMDIFHEIALQYSRELGHRLSEANALANLAKARKEAGKT
ncbi:hypothetical protein ACWCPQ_20910 [Nocardia sp. NPDC001965]